jgi:hypothetical protein
MWQKQRSWIWWSTSCNRTQIFNKTMEIVRIYPRWICHNSQIQQVIKLSDQKNNLLWWSRNRK